MDEVRLNDIGTVFRATFYDGSDVVDISTASTKQLIFRKPDGVSVTKDGSFYTNGTDGKLQYVSASGDLSAAGLWKLQGYIVIGTNQHHSDIYTFRVHTNL